MCRENIFTGPAAAMYSHLIETRHHKSSGKIVVCDIQVQKQTLILGKFSINTNKWLHLEHWLEFEEGLNNLMKSLSAVAISELGVTVFYLKGNIRVNVKRSEKRSNSYKRLIEKTDSFNILVLDIFIEQLDKYELIRKNDVITANQESSQNDLSEESAMNTSEYVPTITKKKEKGGLVCGEYVPYKPSSKVDTLTNNDIDGDLNEPYSPKPVSLLSDSSPEKVSESPTAVTEIPAYKPTRITRSRDKQRTADDTVQAVNNEKEKSLQKPKRRDKRFHSTGGNFLLSPKSQGTPIKEQEQTNLAKKSQNLFGSDVSDHEALNDSSVSPRRSSRPKRLSHSESDGKEVQSTLAKNRSTSKTPCSVEKRRKVPLHQEKCSPELSDFASTPPAVKYPNSPYVSVEKKKRKRFNKYEAVDCSLEKKSLEGWLSKRSAVKRDHNDNQASTLKKSSTPRHPINKGLNALLDNSPSPPHKYATNPHVPLPEISEQSVERANNVDLQMQALQQLRDYVLKHKQPTPEKIAILSLIHMNEEEVLGTFQNFKSILDAIFEKNCNKRRIKGYNGIDHFKTIRLIEDSTQVKMLSFLKEHYQPDAVGIPTLTDLYINAMVPEWTICIFMRKYNFTRDEAIKRLDDQEKYSAYCMRDLDLPTGF